MSKWKPIVELLPGHHGYAWLRHQECISEGWKNPDGYLGYAHGEVDLGQSPTHWTPGVNMEGYIPVRPTFKTHEPKKSKWVRVEDQKPKAGKIVLVVENDVVTDRVRPAYYNAPSHDFRTPGKAIPLRNVTHWRPLPKGPKENE